MSNHNPKFAFIESKNYKIIASEDYNSVLNKNTGFFARWGKNKQDDPAYCEIGPEIMDIEIATICKGVKGIGPCKFCYKANGASGTYMTLETYKEMASKFPKTVGQIAFGIGDIDSNPDMFAIFEHTRGLGIIPNVTVNGEGVTDEIGNKLVENCGAVAVSYYNPEKTLEVVKVLRNKGLEQTNIHFFLAEETLNSAYELLRNFHNIPESDRPKAIVFLSLKEKGRAKGNFNAVKQEDFNKLIEFGLEQEIPIGMDSCSYAKFLKAIKGRDNEETLKTFAEGCESTRFSAYINTEGIFYPCSFMEGEEGDGGDWREGLSVIDAKDFLQDIWHHEKTKAFRDKCVKCTKGCVHYNI